MCSAGNYSVHTGTKDHRSLRGTLFSIELFLKEEIMKKIKNHLKVTGVFVIGFVFLIVGHNDILSIGVPSYLKMLSKIIALACLGVTVYLLYASMEKWKKKRDPGLFLEGKMKQKTKTLFLCSMVFINRAGRLGFEVWALIENPDDCQQECSFLAKDIKLRKVFLAIPRTRIEMGEKIIVKE